MKLTLFDASIEMCGSWESAFKGIPLEILNLSLCDLPYHDYLVTAGNSYGIMNGGIDFTIRNMLGIEFQDTLQWAIVDLYGGFLAPGLCMTINTKSNKFNNVVYSVTMDRPRHVAACNVSVCFYNVLKSIPTDASVACCGLGAGAGGLDPSIVANEMRTAYDLCFS